MASKCITIQRLTEAAEKAAVAGCDTSMTVLSGGILLHCRGEMHEDVDFLSWAEITNADENLLVARLEGLAGRSR